MPDTEDVLIIQGDDGALYAIPRAVLAQYRVPVSTAEVDVTTYLQAAFPSGPVDAPAFQVMDFSAVPPTPTSGIQTRPSGPV